MKTLNEVIVIGVSSGGFNALSILFNNISHSISVPIMIAHHIGDDSGDYLCEHLDKLSAMQVLQAEDKMLLQPGCAYIAPGGYHLLLEEGMMLALSVDERVCYARPSIDVLFESAADVCRKKTTAIILTGANSDGANGVTQIKKHQGYVIVQQPEEAESVIMPRAAIETGCVDVILTLKEIAQHINQFSEINDEQS